LGATLECAADEVSRSFTEVDTVLKID